MHRKNREQEEIICGSLTFLEMVSPGTKKKKSSYQHLKTVNHIYQEEKLIHKEGIQINCPEVVIVLIARIVQPRVAKQKGLKKLQLMIAKMRRQLQRQERKQKRRRRLCKN